MDSGGHRDLFSLTGCRAVVTGATGILGARYAHALAEFGAEVALVDLDHATCQQEAEQIARATGARCIGVEADVSEPYSVARMVSQVESDLGPVDILVNNAATKGRSLEAFFSSTEDYSLETWREIMAVNLDGLFLVAQAIGKRMAERGRGSIINVASIYGIVGPDQRIYEGSSYLDRPINTPAVYSASKAGVIGLTRYLATLWGPAGVRVNTLTPGGVASGQNKTFDQRYSQRVPLGRMARGDEMTGAVLFLASDASSYVTGHNLVVDGGWSIW